MTELEKDAILSPIIRLADVDINQYINRIYKEYEPVLVYVDNFNLGEIAAMYNRAVQQLAAQLKNNNWKILPFSINNSEGTSTDLADIIFHIDSSIINNLLFNEWLPNLLLLVNYEMQYGFWGLLAEQYINSDTFEIQGAREQLNIFSDEVRSRLSQIATLKSDLLEQQKSLNDLKNSHQYHIDQLASPLKSANETLESIRNANLEASKTGGAIDSILKHYASLTQKANDDITKEQQKYNELVSRADISIRSYTNQLNQLNQQSKVFNGVIDNAKNKEENILSKEKEIIKLLGLAADATLATVFTKRQRNLIIPLAIWGVASIFSIAGTIGWVLYIFGHMPSQDSNGANWLVLLANVVRTSPAFILSYFCLAQYSKERNLQEEYAFKAAISTTINNYAELIDSDEERMRMLIATVERIYTPPYIGRPPKSLSMKSKHLSELSQSMVEAAKSIQTSITEASKIVKP